MCRFFLRGLFLGYFCSGVERGRIRWVARELEEGVTDVGEWDGHVI